MKVNKTVKIVLPIILLLFAAISYTGCKKSDFGVGPVQEEMRLGAIDDNLMAKGKQVFDTKCVSCHKFGSRLVGPPLKDVTKRRRPEWIMNQILSPLEMTQQDPVAKELFAQYLVQMTFQDITHDDARAILEYFRAVDAGKVTLAE
ncbi:MAG TPA: cytochrome c [Ignavibacteria bacterium]|nr:cytochrome c [Ignavibacteria bacterium]